ncbi:MAG: TRAM domain-containing protein [Archaeoglobaceae archaeon]
MLSLKEFGFGKPPVKVGDVRDVKIEAVGSEGDGIAKIDGFVVFVPGAKLNDTVKVRITKVLKKYGFAEIVE